MLTSSLEINGCKHFFMNENRLSKIYFIESEFLIETDYDTLHPLGKVYKPKGCVDTPIRFLLQPDNSVLMFKINEWRNAQNPFVYPPQSTYRKFLNFLA